MLHKEWFCWTNGIYSAPLDRIRAYMGGALVGCVLIAMLCLTRVLVVPVQRNLLCSLRFHVRGRRVVARQYFAVHHAVFPRCLQATTPSS